VYFEYSAIDPSGAPAPTVVAQPGCDSAGLEIAMAVALAKLLQRP
jgi:hypothetical protein